MKSIFAALLVLSFSLSGCDYLRGEQDFLNEANKQLAANDLAKAQEALRDGLRKNPKSEILQTKLFDILLAENIEKAETYSKTAGSTGNFDLPIQSYISSHLAQNYFSQKKLMKAAIFYGNAAALTAVEGRDKNDCTKLQFAMGYYFKSIDALMMIPDFARARDVVLNQSFASKALPNCIDSTTLKIIKDQRNKLEAIWLRQ